MIFLFVCQMLSQAWTINDCWEIFARMTSIQFQNETIFTISVTNVWFLLSLKFQVWIRLKSRTTYKEYGAEGPVATCGLYWQFFTVNSLGTKSFSLVTNFLIFLVYSFLIQNNSFSTFSTSASLVMRNIWVEGMHSGSNFFRKANVQLNQNPHPKRILTTTNVSSDARPKVVATKMWHSTFL